MYEHLVGHLDVRDRIEAMNEVVLVVDHQRIRLYAGTSDRRDDIRNRL